MPGRMKAYWNKARLPFSRAAASFRRRIETSFLIQKIASYPLGERFLKDMIFRSGVILYCSLILNFSYGAVQFLAGVCSRSIWLGALAVYHILLAVMQFKLSSYGRKNGRNQNLRAELRLYRFCGITLLLMTPIFASILIQIIHQNSHTEYPGFLIYFAAVFAAGRIGIAVSNAVKFRVCGSPVLSATKIISLITALLSILSLETAILSRYGSLHNPVFYQSMLGTVGGAVCVFTLVRAAAMIVRAHRELKDPSPQPSLEGGEKETS